jgi:hypothetical protein
MPWQKEAISREDKVNQSAKAIEVGEAGSMNKTCQRRQIM